MLYLLNNMDYKEWLKQVIIAWVIIMAWIIYLFNLAMKM